MTAAVLGRSGVLPGRPSGIIIAVVLFAIAGDQADVATVEEGVGL